MRRAYFFLFVVFIVTSCAKQTVKPLSKCDDKLDRHESVMIIAEKDARSGLSVHEGTGSRITESVMIEFSKYATKCTIVDNMRLNEALLEAKSQGYNYVVFIEILEYKERFESLLAIQNQISLRISVYSADSKEIVKSAMLSAKDRWTNVMDGGPIDLLDKPLEALVQDFY